MSKQLQRKKIALSWWWLGGVGGFVNLSLVFAWLILNYFHQTRSLVAPTSQLTRFRFINHYQPEKKQDKVVYGFLPYWNLSKAKLNNALDTVAYFRLAINDQGEVMVNDNHQPEMGYVKLQSNQFLDLVQQLEQNQINLEIVFTIFQTKTAKNFLTSPSAQATFLTNLDSVLDAYPVTGVNLDVEINASDGAKLKKQFSQFVQNTKTHLGRTNPKTKLSVDVYANAASGNNIWDLSTLARVVDYVVLMAYDFHRRGSTQAGPVAPLFGGGDIFATDIHGYLKKTIKQVPPHKILLGIPFYGYQWQTVDHQPQSTTYPGTGTTITYNQVKTLLTRSGVTRKWNSKALSPYLTFTQDNQHYIVYYDDKSSLHYKLELVNQLDLGGIAIWALGYEGDADELWQKISQMLSK